jgi:hypothetical protein
MDNFPRKLIYNNMYNDLVSYPCFALSPRKKDRLADAKNDLLPLRDLV